VRPAARHGIEEVYFLGLALLIGVLASIGRQTTRRRRKNSFNKNREANRQQYVEVDASDTGWAKFLIVGLA
jgi:hypothetical protein